MSADGGQEPADGDGLGGGMNWRGLAVIAAVAVAIWLIAELSSDDEPEPRRNVPPRPSEVVYYLDGTVSYVDATIATPTGTSQQSPDLPMHTKDGVPGLSFRFPSGGFAYISAQLPGDYGSVTCRIVIDGVTVSENSATGDYEIATCKARVP